MKLALMQPYFFPYLGYFDLISRADKFIFFDTVQYMKGGWVNRNRILKNTEEWRYLTVPIKRQPLSTRICDTQVSSTENWRRDLSNRFSYYKNRAPHFERVFELFDRCLKCGCTSLSELNIHCIKEVCAYIGMEWHYELFSEADIALGPIRKASDWALELSIALSASEYINLPGGRDIYEERDFEREGIKLTFVDYPDLEYDCAGFPSIPGLSILDVLMWLPASRVSEYLQRRVGNQRAAGE